MGVEDTCVDFNDNIKTQLQNNVLAQLHEDVVHATFATHSPDLRFCLLR